ncbi:putative CXXCH cytochrome family protein [Chromatocurvus halotolerans]|uniref:Putative CXXCH cytochrome family protein n=1 Tax=Chromatocurvus halotolerans TaxID=1132028 RepID=A0A4R2KQL3_9GAMM|nr:putative CXXCH cytochrome family protein [Chromatocurvus halotolerans]
MLSIAPAGDDALRYIPSWRITLTTPSHLLIALLVALTLPVAVPIEAREAAPAEAFVGSERCAGCHVDAYEQWQGSHHQLAMQEASEETVLGDFSDVSVTHQGVTTRFYRDGEHFMVHTDGADGALRDFPVRQVFGVYPLQQYLLPLDDGRLQALGIAWDARPAEDGGQRWYSLYPDEAIDHTDPLHWTGPYQNWNSRCAECHSTQVDKGYSASERRYATTYREISVGCEACHGPGANHVRQMQSVVPSGARKPGAGLDVDLGQRGHWQFAGDAAIATRDKPLQADTQINACARCHSRRGPLGDYHYGADLLDTHRLALPQPPLYHPDGQIDDEVFVHGSFLQSRMQRAGVVCSNCHEPHNNRLRAEGNALCAQCHSPAAYDSQQHHRHPTGSGAQCVNCHMPAKRYMGVDDRRDHSMRIPRPDLTLVLGTPNACTQCHSERDSEWALESLRAWEMAPDTDGPHPALAVQQLREGDARARGEVLAQIADPALANIWRATALETLAGQNAAPTATPMLRSADPLLRSSAVRSLAGADPRQRLELLYPLRDDPVAAVRMALAENLADIPLGRVSPAQREHLLQLFDEYLAVQARHADMPETQLQLGVFHHARNDLPRAESAYREALALDPSLAAARLNLADLQRQRGDEDAARRELETLLDQSPDDGNALHALGLLEIRTGNRDRGSELLQAAAERESAGWRHRYVNAVALYSSGMQEKGREALRALDRARPGNPAVVMALSEYAAAAGDLDDAIVHARSLVTLVPDNPAYPQWLQRLRQLAASRQPQPGSNTR